MWLVLSYSDRSARSLPEGRSLALRERERSPGSGSRSNPHPGEPRAGAPRAQAPSKRERRLPCFKLGIRFDSPAMVKRFLQSKRTGFYLAVLREGEVGAGDSIEREENRESGLTIGDIVSLYTSDAENQDLLRRATELLALPEGWREYFRKRLWEADS